MILVLMILCGCWKRTEIIRQSVSPIPEDANGLLYIAQEEAIRIGIEGTDTIVRKDIGGYYLIHKEDLKALMKRIREANKIVEREKDK